MTANVDSVVAHPCPGGNHEITPAGQVCCDWCWDRPPTNLPGQPRWRSRRKAIYRMPRAGWAWRDVDEIDAALKAWLADHQADPPVTGYWGKAMSS